MQFNSLSNQVYPSKTASILIIFIVKLNPFLQCDSLGKVKSILIHLLRIQTYRHPGMHSRSNSIRSNTLRLRSDTSLSDPLPHRRNISQESNLPKRSATSESVTISPKEGLIDGWRCTVPSSNFGNCYLRVVSTDSL